MTEEAKLTCLLPRDTVSPFLGDSTPGFCDITCVSLRSAQLGPPQPSHQLSHPACISVKEQRLRAAAWGPVPRQGCACEDRPGAELGGSAFGVESEMYLPYFGKPSAAPSPFGLGLERCPPGSPSG